MNLSNLLDTHNSQVIIEFYNQKYRWQDIKRSIASTQQQLLKHKAQTCALMTTDGFEFVTSLLACIYLNIDLLLPGNDSKVMLESLDADVYLGDFPRALTIQAVDAEIIDRKIDASISIFTSGSTGNPKKITRKLSILLQEVAELHNLWGQPMQSPLFVATVSSQHIYGLLFATLWPLKYAYKIWQKILPFEESLESIASEYDELVLVSSPAFLKRLSINNLALKGKLQTFCSGGLLTQKQHQRAEPQLNSKITQVYGSSETGGIAYRTMQTIWQFFPVVKYKVEYNSLHINSPFCYRLGWVDTNDCIALCGKGFELLGRNDRIVKIEEKRVSLIQLEVAIESNQFVQETCVIALASQRQYIAAIIVLNSQGRDKLQNIGEKKLKQKIKSGLQNQVEKLAIPKKIRFMPEIPLNSQGKIIYQQITAIFEHEV